MFMSTHTYLLSTYSVNNINNKLEFLNVQEKWGKTMHPSLISYFVINIYTSGKNHFHEMNGDVGMARWK